MTDAQWELVEPFGRGNPVGPQPVVHYRRQVLNAKSRRSDQEVEDTA